MRAVTPPKEGRSNRRPGIREVADRAGVAMSSVSRVLSDHPNVSEPMRKKVMAAVEELGYQPDILAQSLRRQVTMSVGFAVSDISNPVLAETITGAEWVLRAAGYSMLVTDAGGSSAVDVENVVALRQRRVDGLLLAPSDEHDPAVSSLLESLETPFVLVDRDVPPGVDAAQVHFEHREGMRQAAEHLWNLGHRKVALISGGPRGPARERRLGIGEVFNRAGGSLIELSGPFTIEHGESGGRRRPHRPGPADGDHRRRQHLHARGPARAAEAAHRTRRADLVRRLRRRRRRRVP